MNRTDKIISESDVGLEENKTQPCDGESVRVGTGGHFIVSGRGGFSEEGTFCLNVRRSQPSKYGLCKGPGAVNDV